MSGGDAAGASSFCFSLVDCAWRPVATKNLTVLARPCSMVVSASEFGLKGCGFESHCQPHSDGDKTVNLMTVVTLQKKKKVQQHQRHDLAEFC